MIDVSEILLDSDLCSAFSILRTTGNYVEGGWASDQPVTINSQGAVRNTSGKELEMLPEADRAAELLSFRSVDRMYTTNAAGMMTSDVLVYQGDQYRVILVKNYSDQGYWLAVATRMAGS
jgi:hypothetical protein